MNLSRRQFLAGITTILAAQDRKPSYVLITAEQASRMQGLVKGNRGDMLDRFAGAALKAGPWSVTLQRPAGLNIDAGPNDYYSEGPYWWPDPKNPTGPYVRKDGQRNPGRFMGNRSDLGNMCTAVLALGMGAAFIRKAGCVDHAAKILSTWFVDVKTRMNPNLEYGQAVRGINTGRGTGIIDTASLIHVAQGVTLLELAGGLDADVATGTRQWFRDYVKWLNTSQKGLDEKKSGNNHATWWTAQVASYASFTGDAGTRRMAWDHYRDYLVPTEIQPDGSCPREEARTQSLAYSSMNLDAFSLICRLAQMDGVDLWHFRTAKDIGVEKSFHYLIPYLLDPTQWKKEQITTYNADGHFFPGLASVGLPSPELLVAYRKLPHASQPWLQFLDLAISAGV
jgi:hypothetical protein